MGKSKLRKFIKSNDMSGHKINLNFNKKGDSFPTSLGGLASLILLLMIFILAFIRGTKMIKK